MTTKSVLLTLAGIGILAGEARAQTRAQSFEHLSTQLSPGAAVVVELADGRRSDGKVESISSDRIQIRATTLEFPHGAAVVPGTRRDFSCLFWIPAGPAVGSLVGGAIDRSVRQALYVAAGGRVQLRPIAGRGMSATLRLGF